MGYKEKKHHGEYLPAYDESMEKAVIGAMLIEREAAPIAIPLLRPEMFYYKKHETIFKALKDMMSQGRPIDIITVADYMRSAGTLDEVGGPYYITALSGGVTSSAHLEYHCGVLFDMYTRRRLVELLTKYLAMAQDITFDHYQVMTDMNGEICNMMENSPIENNLHSMDDVAKMVLETMYKRQETSSNGLTGVTTGLPDLDALTGGWQAGNLITNAGRPGDGKSATDIMFALAAAKAGVHVAYVTLEMSASEIGDRLAFAECNVDPTRAKHGQLTPGEQAEFEAAVERIRTLPIYIDDTPSVSIDRVCAQMRCLKFRGKLGLVIVDYLQLISSTLNNRNREQEVAECSRKLKALARSIKCPVIVSSQLNRQAEDQTTPPDLRHLRESGAIEQDADLVLMIHRPERHHILVDEKTNCSTKGMGILSVAKHRNGSTGRIYYSYNPSMSHITAFKPHPFTDAELQIHAEQLEEDEKINKKSKEIAKRNAILKNLMKKRARDAEEAKKKKEQKIDTYEQRNLFEAN